MADLDGLSDVSGSDVFCDVDVVAFNDAPTKLKHSVS
jgi:hypothetical protein